MIPKLLFDIAKCSEFCSLITNPDSSSSCSLIVDSQKDHEVEVKKDFQLPEPWTGDIINAPILVISSNPGYSKEEIYPDFTWPKPMIADFFMNRFQDRGSRYSWVYDNKVLNNDGERGISVRYWSSIRARVKELLGSAKPGIDYCITEIVHCKSSSEKGVENALPKCSDLYLERKIKISDAKFIIGVGEFVKKYFKEVKYINGIPITYLPHPNAFKPKTFLKTHTEERLDEIKSILSSEHVISNSIEYSDISLPSLEEVKKFIDTQIITKH